MAQRKGISTGTTAQRTIEEAGKMRFNTSNNLLEYYDGNSWKSIDAPPTLSSVSPTNLLTGDGTGNFTIVVTGSGFSTTVTAVILTDGGTEISPDTTTRDSSTQVTLVVAKNKANLTSANEPFDIKITNSSGLSATIADAFNIDASPVFSTAAGSLGTVLNGSRSGLSFTVAAADPESGGDLVYTIESGSIPAGLSFASTSSGAVISGDADAVGSNTTSNFTIRAKDAASNVSDRAFSITVNAPVTQSFTSSGTFSVPSGISAVDVLVVAGGGGGGTGHPASSHAGGGGGAGGLVYRPGFTVTPGGTVSVTVGAGGSGRAHTGPYGYTASYNGQDSVFGTLTAKGGGGGGSRAVGCPNGEHGGHPGGSGGGGSSPTQPGDRAAATQPTQSGESGNYGFGNNGGISPSPNAAAGGGGAGAVGNSNPSATVGGAGGDGKAYTIADGTTSVYYAGGGGGGGAQGAGGAGGQGGAGPGGGAPGGSNETQQPGTANRGGGGGAGGRYGDAPGQNPGGSGGKGIVIVSY
jgi:hypothetical protein